MKVLLLTDIPPCRNFTAGLVLDRLAGFLGTGELAVCAVVNPSLNPECSLDTAEVPHLLLTKPPEAAVRPIAGRLGDLSTRMAEALRERHVRRDLLPRIARFAREQGVDRLWVVLQGQTMVRLARALAERLQLPLHTQVWDPFQWWLRANEIDAHTSKRLLIEFDRVLLHSRSCATASWAMSERYSEQYQVPNLPVIAGLPRDLARPPAARPHQREEFIIAMAGQFYADAEWRCLIATLDAMHWQVLGRPVRVRILGGGFQAWTQQPARFEYLGWHSQEQAIGLLADADLLYLPYWFDSTFQLEASSSFPSKLVTYFATGRPVFCHAPTYASPARYLAEHEAAFLCASMDPPAVQRVLERAAGDIPEYGRLAAHGHAAFLRDFTLERMAESFRQFIGGVADGTTAGSQEREATQ